ncbi:MAG: hypothetical protein FWB86_13670 [Treponema sp.]|nr:hypothetical protein [Treponema sp.]
MKKKIIVALLILVAFVGSASAFDFMSAADGIKDSSILINLGVGLGTAYYSETVLPPVSASIDYLLPIGIPLSVGGYFNMAIYSNGGNKATYVGYTEYTYMSFGLRLAWHIDLGLKNLDLYVGPAVGYLIYNGKNTYWNTYEISYEGGYLDIGGFLGVRFFFIDNVGVWLEAGYTGLTFASLGVSFKF